MKKSKFNFIVSNLFLTLTLFGCQSEHPDHKLMSAPMFGHVGMRHATLWSQSNTGVNTEFRFWQSDSIHQQRIVTTLPDGLNCSEFEFGGLEPNTNYFGLIESVNGDVLSDTISWRTQELWQYRKDPPNFTFAAGSCAFINEEEYDRPGKGYGGDYQVFRSIANEDISGMLWLGDNIYLREVDLSSLSGYRHRYEHMRSLPELQTLLSKGSHYAIWDDHDFGPDNSDGSWPHRDWAKESFDSFWANPGTGLANATDLNVAYFQYSDVDFFLLDNRSHRVNHLMGPKRRQLLGDVQMNWLLNALKNSKAPFKIIAIGGQMISDADIYENFAQFPEEQKMFFDALNELAIPGVIFLTGDRHSTELSQMKLPNGLFTYDLTVSPLTSSSYNNIEEPNTKRVKGTMVGNRNYALLNFSGTRKNRILKMSIMNSAGELIWEKSIDAQNNYACD